MVYAKRGRMGSSYGNAIRKNQELETFNGDRRHVRLYSLLVIGGIYETKK
jgi:hypothetical protein